MDEPRTKKCTKCGEEKVANTDNFPTNSSRKDGLLERCRICHRQALRESRLKHFEKNKHATRLYDRVRKRELYKRQRTQRKRLFTMSLSSKANAAWVVKKPEKLIKNGFASLIEDDRPALEEFEDVMNV